MKFKNLGKYLLLCAAVISMVAGCAADNTVNIYESDSDIDVLEGQMTDEHEILPNIAEDNARLVMIEGKIYSDTGQKSMIDARCGTADGTITSTVKSTEIPGKNNQSNFGEGYDYQYGTDDNTVEINIDGQWIIFEKSSGFDNSEDLN